MTSIFVQEGPRLGNSYTSNWLLRTYLERKLGPDLLAVIEPNNQRLIERAIPHLTSRDPVRYWTSGQWMTESTGGSDVGLSQTVARRDAAGVWRLHGKKWFTSAASSQMALTLARPEGNAPGGSGLAM